jgi:hypothetical protein
MKTDIDVERRKPYNSHGKNTQTVNILNMANTNIASTTVEDAGIVATKKMNAFFFGGENEEKAIKLPAKCNKLKSVILELVS